MIGSWGRPLCPDAAVITHRLAACPASRHVPATKRFLSGGTGPGNSRNSDICLYCCIDIQRVDSQHRLETLAHEAPQRSKCATFRVLISCTRNGFLPFPSNLSGWLAHTGRKVTVSPENRLRLIRPKQDVSQEAPETKSGVSKGTLAFSENGCRVPAGRELEVLAEALGTPLEQLFHEDGQSPSFPHLPNRLSCDDIVRLKRRK